MTCEVRIEDPSAEVAVEFGVLDELDCEIRIGDVTILARWETFKSLYEGLRTYFVPEAEGQPNAE